MSLTLAHYLRRAQIEKTFKTMFLLLQMMSIRGLNELKWRPSQILKAE